MAGLSITEEKSREKTVLSRMKFIDRKRPALVLERDGKMEILAYFLDEDSARKWDGFVEYLHQAMQENGWTKAEEGDSKQCGL